MNQAFDDVLEFHRAMFPDLIGTIPQIPDGKTAVLRWRLILEEFDELSRARCHNDIPGIADGIADLIYVLIGMAISYGIDLRPVWDEVQRSNLRKIGGPRREDGKQCKPPGWKPPDIAGILAAQPPLEIIEAGMEDLI